MRIGVLILPASDWRRAKHDWQAADELGFAHAWTYDHIAWRDMVGKRWYAAVPTLTAAAACTTRIRLGALVFSPNFRHPVPFAKEVVTLDDISDGRFLLALGAGSSGVDAEVLGTPPWGRGERRERFTEFVTLTDQLLRQPRTDYAGRYYRAHGAIADPAGTARNRFPLLVAGSGPTAVRLAARYADGWVTNGVSPRGGQVPPEATPELVRAQVDAVRAACREHGRDPASLRKVLLHINRRDPVLASLKSFTDSVRSYEAAGITDMVVPFPRTEPPFVADPGILHRIAGEMLGDQQDGW